MPFSCRQRHLTPKGVAGAPGARRYHRPRCPLLDSWRLASSAHLMPVTGAGVRALPVRGWGPVHGRRCGSDQTVFAPVGLPHLWVTDCSTGHGLLPDLEDKLTVEALATAWQQAEEHVGAAQGQARILSPLDPDCPPLLRATPDAPRATSRNADGASSAVWGCASTSRPTAAIRGESKRRGGGAHLFRYRRSRRLAQAQEHALPLWPSDLRCRFSKW